MAEHVPLLAHVSRVHASLSLHCASFLHAGATHWSSQQLRPPPHGQSRAQLPHPSPLSQTAFPQQGTFGLVPHVPLWHVLSVQLPASPLQPVWGPVRGRCSHWKSVLAAQSSDVQGLPSLQFAGHCLPGVGVAVGAGVAVGVIIGVGVGVGVGVGFEMTQPTRSHAPIRSTPIVMKSFLEIAMELNEAPALKKPYQISEKPHSEGAVKIPHRSENRLRLASPKALLPQCEFHKPAGSIKRLPSLQVVIH